MYTIKKILLKKYLRQINFSKALFYVVILMLSVSKQHILAQQKELPSLFSNFDHYYYYRVDTINRNDKILDLPNHSEDTFFLIYSLVKLWNEDACGHKGYKVNIAKYLAQKLKEGHLVLYRRDVMYYLGLPFDTSEYRYNGILNGDDSTGIYVPELDENVILLKYPIIKGNDCKHIKEFVVFNIDQKSNKVCSISFVSDFFDETEIDVGR
ncbi:MAG: hypothetical protein BGO31_12385 [Bacteroidetes bacterium 43-16]|nr:MAG: hypothetical protein BGO31_12385 [Bacteroidetes bacterium 43-16]